MLWRICLNISRDQKLSRVFDIHFFLFEITNLFAQLHSPDISLYTWFPKNKYQFKESQSQLKVQTHDVFGEGDLKIFWTIKILSSIFIQSRLLHNFCLKMILFEWVYP